jgi:hypothetical protein
LTAKKIITALHQKVPLATPALKDDHHLKEALYAVDAPLERKKLQPQHKLVLINV